MGKTKKITEPYYELLYIISNKFTEDEVKPIAEKIEAVVSSNEGTVTYREDWGKKKLAYPIQHFSFGYYRYIEFDVLPANIAKIERSIRLMHEVIRHQLIARTTRTADLKEKPKPLFINEPKKDATGKPEIKASDEIATSKTSETSAPSNGESAEVKTTKVVKPAKETKVNMEELDAKLDKILETNDLL